MDRQYQYVFIGDSDYHGLLSHDPIEYADPVSEEGMRRFRREQDDFISTSSLCQRGYPLK